MTHSLTAGLGLKPIHFPHALAASAAGLWFEVHPENYMVAGGPRLAWLDRVRSAHPLSLHGVALSLAAEAPPAPDHLARLKVLIDRFEPVLVSEHLAWSTWRGVYYPDLLPVARTQAALRRVTDNVQRVQDALGRAIAVENPAHYLPLAGHEMDEAAFLDGLARRSGCRLLLDVANVFVAANNLGFDPAACLASFPVEHVAEIHLAGHMPDPEFGGALLIDSHSTPVAPAVWALYAGLVGRIGPRPTLIERDEDIPAFGDLIAERERAHRILAAPAARRAA
ncbi:MAG: DUF692 domain-containing protein [Rhodospirillales bacterium]|nr:DUF692 domain-containing protein [Rhodospirillales bacterium]